MEKMMMKPQYSSTPTSNSHKISKSMTSKPTVRIIHVFAPEIIKTEVANFLELVQILTGRPEPTSEHTSIAGRKRKIRSSSSTCSSPTPSKKILELESDGRDERVLVMEEMHDYMWRSSSSLSGDLQSEKINGLLDGFSDLDGFIEELSTGFPSLQS